MRFWTSWVHEHKINVDSKVEFTPLSKPYGKDRIQSYAVIDDDTEQLVKDKVSNLYPDADFKFCMQKPNSWKPSMDAFPTNENKRRR